MARKRDFYMKDLSEEQNGKVSEIMSKANNHAKNGEYSKAVSEASKFFGTANCLIPVPKDCKNLDKSNVGDFENTTQLMKWCADNKDYNTMDLEAEKLAKYR